MGKRQASPIDGTGISFERAVSGAHRAIDRISEAARPVVVRSATNVHHLVDNISGTAGRAVERLGQTATRVRYAEQRLVGASRSYVREHPLKSAGIALAVGFVVGQLIRLRNSPELRDSENELEASVRDDTAID